MKNWKRDYAAADGRRDQPKQRMWLHGRRKGKKRQQWGRIFNGDASGTTPSASSL
jgi:hypothetical protein